MEKHSKTPARRQQNFHHKVANSLHKFVLHTQKKFFLNTKNLYCTPKKIDFVLQKWQLAHFFILSQLLALCRFKQIRRTTLLLS
jgi:hypothetical protein